MFPFTKTKKDLSGKEPAEPLKREMEKSGPVQKGVSNSVAGDVSLFYLWIYKAKVNLDEFARIPARAICPIFFDGW